jgi:hypothetical protein
MAHATATIHMMSPDVLVGTYVNKGQLYLTVTVGTDARVTVSIARDEADRTLFITPEALAYQLVMAADAIRAWAAERAARDVAVA